MPQVVDLKLKHKRNNLRVLPLEQVTGAGRFFTKMVRDIERELGGRRALTRIELEWIQAYCGAATQVRYLNYQVMLGEGSEIDPDAFAKLASTMLKLGSKLGLRPRKAEKPTFGSVLSADYDRQQIEDGDRDRQRRDDFEQNQRAARAAGASDDVSGSDDNEVA